MKIVSGLLISLMLSTSVLADENLNYQVVEGAQNLAGASTSCLIKIDSGRDIFTYKFMRISCTGANGKSPYEFVSKAIRSPFVPEELFVLAVQTLRNNGFSVQMNGADQALALKN